MRHKVIARCLGIALIVKQLEQLHAAILQTDSPDIGPAVDGRAVEGQRRLDLEGIAGCKAIPGASGARAFILVELQAAVTGAQEKLGLAVAVQVSSCRRRHMTDIDGRIGSGHQLPVGARERTRIAHIGQ